MDSENKKIEYQEGTSSVMKRCPQKNGRKRNHRKRVGTIPKFLPFSGNEPTPTGECGVEEFLFQIKGAKRTQKDHQIRLAILLAVRGDAQEFIKFIGADLPLEKIMQYLRERYWKKERVGDLWNDFCELQQKKEETIEQFVDRLETAFHGMRSSLGKEIEGDKILQERLLKGMLPALRNSIEYLKEETATYGALIKSAQKAEGERRRIEADLNSTLKEMKDKEERKKVIGKSNITLEQRTERRKRKIENGKPTVTAAGPFTGREKPRQCWRCGGWGHTSRECSTQGSLQWNEKEKLESTSSSGAETEQDDTLEKTEGSPPKRAQVTEKTRMKQFKKGVAKCIRQTRLNYYNPDPMVQLIGEANESMIQVNDCLVKALIDSGAQVSTMARGLAKMMNLKIHKLRKILKIEGTGGGDVPYDGYVEVELQLPQIKHFQEKVLMLVVNDSDYGERVPIQLGTLHIDMILDQATKEELAILGRTWERGRVGRTVVNKQAEVEGFDLNSVQGPIKISGPIAIKAGQTLKTQGITVVKGNFKRINVMVEPLGIGEDNAKGITALPAYAMCKAGSCRVNLLLKNETRRDVRLEKGQVVATLSTANLIPNKIAPRYRSEGQAYAEAYATVSKSNCSAYAGVYALRE